VSSIDLLDLIAESVSDRVVQKLIALGMPDTLAASVVVPDSQPARPRLPVVSAYDSATCAEFANALGNGTLAAAKVMFGLLDSKGEVGALELMNALGLDRTPTIAFVVTTPVKRVAGRMGLKWPFDPGVGKDGRTVWRDYDGIAARMLEAVNATMAARGL
jgi:hypothetical protein